MQFLKKIWRPLLALTLILFLIKKGPFDLNQLRSVLSEPKIIYLGLFVFLLQIFLFSARWKLFVDLVAKFSFLKSVQLTLIGQFFNFFIPGGVGGDIIKALELSKNSDATRSQALSTVLSDRVFGLFAMISFSSAFLIFEYVQFPSEYILKICLISLFMFLGIIGTLLFMPLIFKKISTILSTKDSKLFINIEKFVSSLNFTFVTFRNIRIQSSSLIISFISQLLAIYFLYFVVITLGIQPPSFLIFFSLCCFGFLASALPIMPGGIGVGQYAFYVLFSHISEDLGKSTITAITTLQIFTLLYALFGGVIFSLNPNAKKDIEEYEKENPIS